MLYWQTYKFVVDFIKEYFITKSESNHPSSLYERLIWVLVESTYNQLPADIIELVR